MKRFRVRMFAVALGIPLLLTILVACGTGTASPGNGPGQYSTLIKIGTDLPVTGKDASVGKPVENGVSMAINEANAQHVIQGYQLELVPKDDVGLSGAHDPAVGIQNITGMIGDALIAGIIGPFNSNVAQAELPISNQAPIVQLSPSNTNTCLTQVGANVGCSGSNDLLPTIRPTGKVTYFRIATTDNHQGPANADFLYKTYNLRKVYVVDDAETYGVGIANAFIKEWQLNGGTVSGHSSEPSTTTSYLALLTAIASMHPDLIYFGGTTATGGALLRQQMGLIPGLKNTPFAGGDGIIDSSFISTVGLSGGPIFGTVATINADKLSTAQSFIARYKSIYGADAYGAYSAAGYDCGRIMIQAIKAALAGGAHTPLNSSDVNGAKAFRQAVINAMQDITYDGVLGHQSFDANGDTTNKVISIYQLGLNANGKPDWVWKAQVIEK